jgi:hypothetical protein
MDQAIKASIVAAQQPPPPPPPDPKLQAIQAESQAKIAILQEQAKADAQKDAAKQQMELERAAADHQAYLEGLTQQKQLADQKFQNEMELLKAQLVVNLAKLTAQQKADTSNEAIKLIHTAEQTRMEAASDTHQAVLGAAQEEHAANKSMEVTTHQTDKQKEAATHAAKVQVQSQDKGNGASK